MAEDNKDEKKLGPNVTYDPNEGEGAPSVTMGGITFAAGEAVNVVDMLGEEQAQETLKRLAGNPSFKVDGGPDHKAQAEKRQQAEEKGRQAADKAREKEQQTLSEQRQAEYEQKGEQERQEREKNAQMPEQPKPADDERPSSRRR